jgi:hypothetical protein
VHAGSAKAATTVEGAQKRSIATTTHAHAKGLRSIDEINLEAFGAVVEAVGKSTKKPHRGWPKNRQPKLFDIGRPWIVTELINDRV